MCFFMADFSPVLCVCVLVINAPVFFLFVSLFVFSKLNAAVSFLFSFSWFVSDFIDVNCVSYVAHF